MKKCTLKSTLSYFILLILTAVLLCFSLISVRTFAVGVACTDETCPHVAIIGDVHYDTLSEAVAAVKISEDIRLIKDPADDDIAVVNRPVSFSVTGYSAYNNIVAGDSVKIKVRGMNYEDYVIENYTLYDCEITYDPNEGTSRSETLLSDGALSGNYYTLSGAFHFTAPEGKRFGAWEIDGSLYHATERVLINKNTTIKAIWVDDSEVYNITFNCDNGEDPIVITTGALGRPTSVPTASREGYEFLGWYNERGSRLNVTAYFVFYEDTELTARWSPYMTAIPTQSGKDNSVNIEIESDNIDQEKIEALKQVASSVNVDNSMLSQSVAESLDNNVSLADAQNALSNAGIEADETVSVVVQSYLEVNVEKYEDSSEGKYISLDISPKYDLIATISENTENIILSGNNANAVVLEAAKDAEIADPLEISLQLPVDSFEVGRTVYIEHIKDNGDKYIYKSVVDEDLYISFENPNGFSKFNISEFVFGDLNEDCSINSSDAVLLAQYIAKWNVEPNGFAADCNNDGTINTKDAVLLAQYLAKWNVSLG